MSAGLLAAIVIAVVLVLTVLAVAGTRRRRGRPPGAPGLREPAPASEAEAPVGEAEAPPRGLAGWLRGVVGRGAPTEDDWEALEEALLRADAGVGAAREVVARVRAAYEPGAAAEELLIAEIARAFQNDPPLSLSEGLGVIMVVGVNGTGKTTTIGKLAGLFVGRGRSVALAASDTFRAGAVEQLTSWAERAGAAVVAQERGADPGAVAFDAVQAAKARGYDVLIVDTAGRIHTRQPLMDELRKVRRVLEKAAGRLDEVLLVVDATTGQNGIAQARTFLEAVDVTGIALTKLDGTAKGGIVLAIREELGVPVKIVGTGEGIGDVSAFDPATFASSLVGA